MATKRWVSTGRVVMPLRKYEKLPRPDKMAKRLITEAIKESIERMPPDVDLVDGEIVIEVRRYFDKEVDDG